MHGAARGAAPAKGGRVSADAASVAALQGARRFGRAAPRDSLARGLAAFLALAAFVSLQYATLLTHTPVAGVLGAAAAAGACGAALVASAHIAPAPLGTVLRLFAVLLAFLLGVLAIGVPAHLLAPARWGTLRHDLTGGVRGLDGLWPYLGASRWARLAVLAVVPVVLLAAAATSFWPTRRGTRVRPLLSLAMLLALLTVGVVNQVGGAWRVQGVFLAGLIAAWLWLPRLSAGDLNRAGAWLIACLLPALVLAPVLSASGPWIDYRKAAPAPTASFGWDQTYGPIPWSRSEATMFEIAGPHLSLLRVTVLDRFDGVRFLRSSTPAGSPTFDVVRSRSAASSYERAIVTIAGLRSDLLVAAGGYPTDITWLTGEAPAMLRADDGTISLGSAPTEGARYSVRSYVPAASPAALERAGRSFPRAYLPYTLVALPGRRSAAAVLVGSPIIRGTQGPDRATARALAASPYAPTFALARRLAAGERTTYGVVRRIAGYLHAGFTYDERPAPRPYPLQAFLLQTHRGYCQQFSGAMALLLRMNGIPARIAAGFRPRVYDAATGALRVRALDAHSWVEVYFAGVGWVPFDPTPALGPNLLNGRIAALSKGALLSAGGARSSGAAGRAAPTLAGRRAPGAAAGARPWLLAGGALAVIAMLALALGWLAGARRLARALGGDGAEAIAELRWALARVGEPVAEDVTLTQLEARLEQAGRGAGSAYLSALRDARYRSIVLPRSKRRARAALRSALGRGGALRMLRAIIALPPGAARGTPRRGRQAR